MYEQLFIRTDMAGSIKWVVYTADDDKEYAVKLDESNTEIEILGFRDFELGDQGVVQPLPPHIQMRHVYCRHGLSTRKIYVGKKDSIVISIGGALSLLYFGGAGIPTFEAFIIFRYVSEKVKVVFPFPDDTFLDDGDPT